MRTPPFAIATALLLAHAVAFAGSEPLATIGMRPIAEAHGNEVVLGELAIVHAKDLATVRKLVSLPLGDRAAPGGEKRVRREEIVRWVRMQLGLLRREVEWSGATETIVRTAPVDRGPQPLARMVSSEPVQTKLPSIVGRGDWVTLQMKRGGLEVETRAQALQEGAAGQLVQVQSPAASAPVSARVIDAGRVEAAL